MICKVITVEWNMQLLIQCYNTMQIRRAVGLMFVYEFR